MEITQFFTSFISLFTLTVLEVVLGIDNLVFISIASSRLPKKQQNSARRIGLLMAWVTRLILLASAVWIIGLTKPLFTVFTQEVSGRDLLLFTGGLFLLLKATQEIHAEIEAQENSKAPRVRHRFAWVVTQIAIMDMVFSIDSVITAIGLTQEFWIMAVAISIAIIVMIWASEPLGNFINRHPTIKILALSFLLLIGTVLIADGLHFHVPRGYLYFAICFSILVEFLNNLVRKKRKYPHS